MMLVRPNLITWLSWCSLDLSIVKVPNLLDNWEVIRGVILGDLKHILFSVSDSLRGFRIHF